jgi:hypothetical protein
VTRDVTTRERPRGPVLGLALLAIAATVAVGGLAAAHPFGERFYAHRIVLRTGDGALGLQYSTEIPSATVMRRFADEVAGLDEVGEAEDRAFTERMLVELASNLAVHVDGEPVTLTWGPVPGQASGVGTGEFFAYHVQAELPLTWSEQPVEVLVTNDNALEWPAYYSGWIFTDGGVQVTRSSLQGIGQTASRDDVFQQADAWSRNPVYRDVAATFVAGGAALQEREAAAGAPPRLTRTALAWVAGGILALALFLGLLRRRAAR